MELATSTIGMSAYNMLALAPRQVTVGELYVSLCQAHEVELSKEQYIEAMKILIGRGVVHLEQIKGDQDRVSLLDPLRRRVRWRDRSGDGWGNWMVEDPRGPQRLEDVINGIH